jgi:hypothetical protein
MLADCGLEVVGEADSAAAGSAAGERLRLDVMLPDIDGVALGHGSQQAPACARRREPITYGPPDTRPVRAFLRAHCQSQTPDRTSGDLTP